MPAFLLAAAPSPSGHPTESASPAAASAVTPALGGTGTADYIPIWTDSSGDLGNSAMFQSGTGGIAKIGINTTTPATTLESIDVGQSALLPARHSPRRTFFLRALSNRPNPSRAEPFSAAGNGSRLGTLP